MAAELIESRDIDGADISTQARIVTKINAGITQANLGVSGSESAQSDATQALADAAAAEAMAVVNAEAVNQEDDFLRGDVLFQLMGADTFLDCHDVTTGKVGSGTNVISGGKNVLTTDATSGDTEKTSCLTTFIGRGGLARLRMGPDSDSNSAFKFGLEAPGTRHLFVTFDTDVDGNLHVELNDGSGAETVDTGIAFFGQTLDVKFLVGADGTPTVEINGTEIDLSTLTKVVANFNHAPTWQVTTRTTAAKALSASWYKFLTPIA